MVNVGGAYVCLRTAWEVKGLPPQRAPDVFLEECLEGGGVIGGLAGDADGRNPAPSPVAVTVGVVRLAGSAVMVGPVNLDDRGAAVAEHDEIGSAHAGVAQLRPRQRQH